MSTSKMEQLMQISGDQLRNENSHDYLKQFSGAVDTILEDEKLCKRLDKSTLKLLHSLPKIDSNYDKAVNIKYGDLYTKFLTNLEEKLPLLLMKLSKDEEINKIYNLVDIIYFNKNKALPNSINQVSHIIETMNQTKEHDALESAVTQKLNANQNTFGKNKTTPQKQGSNLGRLKSMISRNYKPQLTTSMASVRKYTHNQNDTMTEIRFGTQGQRDGYKERVSPLFQLWIESQQRKQSKIDKQNSPITHVYFNNLRLDITHLSILKLFEGRQEAGLSNVLHNSETENPNLAVITLPADLGIMDELILVKKGQVPLINAKQILLTIATRDSDKTKNNNLSTYFEGDACDFKISNRVKELIYPGNTESEVLNELINKSINKLGFEDKKALSFAELQALFFHFSKYELANHILGKLQPKTFNFSCKDAIDRGGVSSAYYNLITSIERPDCNPMTKKEFMEALHAAPTLVKGRSMNHHVTLIWNAVSEYTNNSENSNKIPEWLTDWVFENCPTDKTQYYIEKSIKHLVTLQKKYKDQNSSQFKVLQHSINSLNDTHSLIKTAKPGAYNLIYQSALLTKSFATRAVEHLDDPQDETKKTSFDAIKKRYSNLCNKTESHYFTLYKLMTSLLKNIVSIITRQKDPSITTDNKAEEITALNQDLIKTSENVQKNKENTEDNEVTPFNLSN